MSKGDATTGQKKYEATLNIVNKIYDNFPAFTDIFDEESFYIFAGVFTLCTIMGAIIASRFITLKPAD